MSGPMFDAGKFIDYVWSLREERDTLRTANQRLEADAARWNYYEPKVAALVGATLEEMNAEIDAALAGDGVEENGAL